MADDDNTTPDDRMPVDRSWTDSEDDEYFGTEAKEDEHRGDANKDPQYMITINLTMLNKESTPVPISLKDSLETLLKKIAGEFNPNGTRYLLKKADGDEIDLDEDEMTMEQLKLTTGSVLSMTPR